ncbi:MAG: ATP-binding cassette domain-containing protein [Candidatus Calditenuis sp.]|nr:ATP-binding cassette domain-containing protein [Candidatus Calditenuis sp.]
MLRLRALRARRGEWKGPEVNASIGEGSVVALVGPNGSGKTSTLLAVAGLLEREGSVEIDGVELSSIDRRTLRSTVSYVPEDPTSYVVRNYVLDEVLAGPEFLGMDPGEALRRSLEALEAVGLRERADDPVEHLSGGQLQRLVMACSLVTSPSVLLVDDAVSQVDSDGRKAIAEAIGEAVKRGTTVLIAVSDLERLPLRPDSVIELPHDREEELRLPELLVPRNSGMGAILEAKGVRFGYPGAGELIKDLNLRAEAGEVIGITGPNGSGKTTALKLLTGLLRPRRGKVLLNGSRPSPPRSLYMPQNPDPLLTERTVWEELEPLVAAKLIASPDAELKAELERTPIGHLGAGSRRVLAAYLLAARRPSVLALDEPTAGLDRRNSRLIGSLVREAASQGSVVLVSSHDEPFVESVSDRVFRVEGGRLVEL